MTSVLDTVGGVSEWVSEWVWFNNSHQHIIGHFGDESFQLITCTGTDSWWSDWKGMWPLSNWTLVCGEWWFEWNFAHFTVLVVSATASIIYCCSKIRNDLTFWYQLTRVILLTGHKNKCVLIKILHFAVCKYSVVSGKELPHAPVWFFLMACFWPVVPC